MTTDSRPTSTILSVGIHLTAIALLFTVSKTAQRLPAKLMHDATPLIAPFLPKPLKALGGGGGGRQETPATAGRLPEMTRRQFVPPTLEIINPAPKLTMAMSIEAPPDISLPEQNLPQLGNPLSNLPGLSAGVGGRGGIGDNGRGTGVGNHSGASIGDGGLGGTVYSAGSGVTMPVILYKVDPEFSEDARRARFSGSVLLWAVVDANGIPRSIRVGRSVGMGLDEKAVEAVSKWKFKPGTKDGKPVAVSAAIEVSFHLL